MKKRLLLVALTGVSASIAHAQSSVTLYGLMDSGVSYTNNVRGFNSSTGGSHGSSDFRFGSGLMQSDLWGLKGTEDLGGGLKAVFDLENGFDVGNGTFSQGGREFGRNAYVGLSSVTAGTLTLGRQDEFMYDYVSRLSFENFNDKGGNAFAHAMDNDNMAGTFRIDNSVKYASPNYSGLVFGGLYGFSNQAGEFANNRAYSLGATYENGPIKAALAYTQLNNGPYQTLERNNSGAVDYIGDSQFTAQRQRTFGGGLNYSFGAANVGFVITDTQLNNGEDFSGGTAFAGATPANVRFTNYEVNAHYNLTPALTLGFAYTYTDGRYTSADGAAAPKWNQFSLSSDYALSKRTDIYALSTYQHLSGGFALGADGIQREFEGAGTYAGGTAASPNQVVFGVGLRTRF